MSNQLECPTCPYCGEPLVSKTKDIFDLCNLKNTNKTTVWYCQNPECEESEDFIGTRELWESFANARNIFAQGQENTKELAIKLMQNQKDLGIARKALDVAVDALKRLEKELYFNNAKQTGHIADSVMSIPSIALDKITTLEQKD